MKQLQFIRLVIALGSAAMFSLAASVHAETKEIHAAQQHGLNYLPLMVMEDQHLVEKHARALGLGDLKVSWARLGGPAAMNDGILTGRLDFASGGVPSLVALWSKTRDTPLWVKGVGALSAFESTLVTNSPNIKTIRDFGPKDKISVTGVKISTHAILLQMAAAQAFGIKDYARLDPLTVSMAHPDSIAALMSGSGGITAHFSSAPYQYKELADPRIHRVTSNYEIQGGKSTVTVVWASSKFVNENPKAYRAFVDAFEEADHWINTHPQEAARTYQRMAHAKETVNELVKIMTNPLNTYTLQPQNILDTAVFMHKVGTVKYAPASWKDLFFSNVHHYQGS